MQQDTVIAVDFALEQTAVGSTVTVGSIAYGGHGGPNNDRHLRVIVSLEDDTGEAASGASVSIRLQHEAGPRGTAPRRPGTMER